jgi:hypothetical protein
MNTSTWSGELPTESLEVRAAELARTIAASVASIAVVLGPDADARAGEPCARVEAPTELSDAWAHAVAELRAQLAQLPASDCQAMTLSLEPREQGMRVVAVTADGRRAERTVRRAESLVAVALGLTMTIPEGEPSPGAVPVLPTSAPNEARVGPAPQPLVPPGPRTAAASGTLGLWAGLSAGIRLAAPASLTSLDVEGRADIVFGRWIMFATLQSALVSCLGQQGVDCDVYKDVSVGAGVARRFRVGEPDLDLGFEPSLVTMHMEYDAASGAEGQSVEETLGVLRLDVSARLAIPVDQHWILTLTLAGGLAPSLLARPIRLALPAGAGPDAQPPPAFPAWSGGVRVGVSGALL